MPNLAPPFPYEVRARSAPEARELLAAGWPTAMLAAVDAPELAVGRPDHLAPEHHLVLPFADVVAAGDGPVVHAEHGERLVAFARGLPVGCRLLVHCAAGIARSTACALGVRIALGTAPYDALQAVLADRPQARPNPLVVVVLDEALALDGALWTIYHRWAARQPWWTHALPLRGPFSAADVRHRLAAGRGR
jgi:predicted protein tyrosine phosphatase